MRTSLPCGLNTAINLFFFIAATYRDNYLIKALAATVVTALMLHSVLFPAILLYCVLTG